MKTYYYSCAVYTNEFGCVHIPVLTSGKNNTIRRVIKSNRCVFPWPEGFIDVLAFYAVSVSCGGYSSSFTYILSCSCIARIKHHFNINKLDNIVNEAKDLSVPQFYNDVFIYLFFLLKTLVGVVTFVRKLYRSDTEH